MIFEMIAYIQKDYERYLTLIEQHVVLDLIAFVICVGAAVPLGYLCAKKEKAAIPIMAAANLIMVIPSLALFALLQPILGIGNAPALTALVFLSIPTMLISTRAGIQGVDPSILENASGMGMPQWKVCLQVEIPLAMPAILNGFRVTAVSLIAGTTIAAYVGAGGLGFYIKLGLTARQHEVMYIGALTVAAMAILVDCILAHIQKKQIEKIA